MIDLFLGSFACVQSKNYLIDGIHIVEISVSKTQYGKHELFIYKHIFNSIARPA